MILCLHSYALLSPPLLSSLLLSSPMLSSPLLSSFSSSALWFSHLCSHVVLTPCHSLPSFAVIFPPLMFSPLFSCPLPLLSAAVPSRRESHLCQFWPPGFAAITQGKTVHMYTHTTHTHSHTHTHTLSYTCAHTHTLA